MKLTEEQVENVRAWSAALRSGEYTQGRFKLKTVDGDLIGYCCLGVGAEVFIKRTDGAKWVGSSMQENCELVQIKEGRLAGLTLPSVIADYFGIEENGSNEYLDKIIESQSLVYLNDRKKYSFEQIADVLDQMIELSEKDPETILEQETENQTV